jgi:uncharacterized RDD family membrane protein YckC
LVIALVVVTTYGVVMLGRRGQTIGMMVTGIRAVDQASGQSLTWPQTWRRVIALYVLSTMWSEIGFFVMVAQHHSTSSGLSVLFGFVAFIGIATTFLWPLGNPLNQTLQDKYAHTIVVKTPSRPTAQ